MTAKVFRVKILTYSRMLKHGDSFHGFPNALMLWWHSPSSWDVWQPTTRAMPKHFGSDTHSPQELMSQLTSFDVLQESPATCETDTTRLDETRTSTARGGILIQQVDRYYHLLTFFQARLKPHLACLNPTACSNPTCRVHACGVHARGRCLTNQLRYLHPHPEE